MYDLQKAGMFKRFSAFLFDAILIAVIATALAWLFTVALNFDANLEEYRGYYTEYEEKYNIKISDMTAEEYEKLSEEEKAIYDAAGKEFSEDQRVIKVYSKLINKIMITLTFSILIAFVVWEVVIPLILKNGQTLGKKIFGICLMHVNGVKVNGVSIFVRTILGKYTVGTMIPLYMIILIMANSIGIVGVFVLFAIPILQVILMIFTNTNSAIHDALAQTVAVDYASQMIFNSIEEKNEFIRASAEAAASSSPYFNGSAGQGQSKPTDQGGNTQG